MVSRRLTLKSTRPFLALFVSASAMLGAAGAAASADLGGTDQPKPVAAPSKWSFSFTPNGWIPWLSGDMVVKGRAFDVAVDPIQLFEHLDWSTLPAWMSYAEARRGPLSLFNDIIYANVTGSGGVSRSVSGGEATATFGANVKADYTLAIIEAGGAYAIWSRGRQGSAGATAFDVLAGARYWHQEVDVSADLTGTLDRNGLTISGNRAIASSGSVDWVDPFVGARLRHQLAPGEEIVVRGDVGGFGVGSQFTWQAIATYNWQLCVANGIPIDGYAGFRALSADFSQGSGTSRFVYDNTMYGPVLGATMRF